MRLHKQSAFVSFIAGILASFGLQTVTAPPAATPNAISCSIVGDGRSLEAVETQDGAQSIDGAKLLKFECNSQESSQAPSNFQVRAGGFLVLLGALATFLWSARLGDIRDEIARYSSLSDTERDTKVDDIYTREKAMLILSLAVALVATSGGLWLAN